MIYSILIPYFNRSYQLYKTLRSFEYHYKDRNDYEIVIAEDIKTIQDIKQHQRLIGVIAVFTNLNIVHIKTNYENCWNPASLFCDASKVAKGKYFIITNPEVVHKSNILNALDKEFEKDENIYIICSCENIENYKSFYEYKHLTWYQHSKHRNRMLHFCTAISKENYFKIGGFDKRYRYGAGVDDVDFIEKVKKSNLKIIVRDDLETLHLDHGLAQDIIPDYDKLWKINKDLFKEIHEYKN